MKKKIRSTDGENNIYFCVWMIPLYLLIVVSLNQEKIASNLPRIMIDCLNIGIYLKCENENTSMIVS